MYYPELLQQRLVHVCPSCLGICTCKACLRKQRLFVEPTWPADYRNAAFVHVLHHACSSFADVIELEDRALAVNKAARLPEPQWQMLHDSESQLCDVCAASVANLFYRCATCGLETCVACGLIDIPAALAAMPTNWCEDLQQLADDTHLAAPRRVIRVTLLVGS